MKLPKSTKFCRSDLDNVDFKIPKAQKSIGDAPEDLAGISVNDMVLIPVFYSIFARKAIVDC